MPIDSERALSSAAVTHINHAMAAIYLIGGIYCIAGFFEVSDIPVKALVISCGGLGILFGGMALVHLFGIFSPKTIFGAVMGVAIAAVSTTMAYAYSSRTVSQMKLETQEFEAEMRAKCAGVDEKTFRTRQDLRDACKGFRE